ncbi:putative glycosidase [Escovopsis weberi]|uniref:Putative glycosidase n=1 Tax=Escovopsis weberi TaxID=150374 RepID=A0A0M8MRT3_ESCWE|nr:putative glycosidase [Escovopsis weberi]
MASQQSPTHQPRPLHPAFAGKASFDFTSAGWNDDFADFWTVDTDSANNHDHIDFKTGSEGKGASLGLWAPGQAPTLTSNKYLLFGKVSVEVLAAQGRGIITAIVLKSDSGDEIDWELLGAYENQAQTNYFYDGQALFNTYNTTYRLNTSSFAASHKYSIDWSPHALVFAVDDHPRKTWLPGDIPAHKWPQTPMQVKLGIWAVNNVSDPGEIAWAGGVPALDPARPARALFRSLVLEDLVGMCNRTAAPAEGRVEYLYDERTRGWGDIQIRGCALRAAVPGVPDITGPGSGGVGPTRTGDGDDAPTSPGGNAPPEETGDDEGGAALTAGRLSSPLAAVVFLVWILIF